MEFNLNYRKLWEGLKAEAAMMPFSQDNANNRIIMQLASEFILKKMEAAENAQREEFTKIKELFNSKRT